MPYDPTGYHPRWVVPCVDLFGHPQRIIVAPVDGDRPAMLFGPISAALLTADELLQLAQDLTEVARSLKPRKAPDG